MGYSRKVFEGFWWLGILKAVTKGMSFAKIVILARFLSPKDFGVFGITTAVLALVERLTETGINTFLMQKKEGYEKYVHSAWVIAIFRGGLIAVVLCLLALFLPGYYNESALTQFILFASLIPLIKGCINPSVITYWKQLKFEKEAAFRGSIHLIEGTLSIALPIVFSSPIGLMYALLISACVEVILSHILMSPKPKFLPNWSLIKEILHSSKWLNISGLSNYLVNNADNLIIGKILGAGQLGFYQTAFNVANATTGDVGDLGAQTVFPIYTAIRDDKKRLKHAMVRAVVGVGGLIALPIVVILLQPSLVVRFVLGETWLPIVPLLPYLYAALWLKGINLLMYPIFLATEQVKRSVLTQVLHVVVMISLIIPMAKSGGTVGASQALLLSYLFVQPVMGVFLHKTFSKSR